MRVGVLTGGGDCPGLNAVIRAVTKSLIHQCNAEVIGIEDGYLGLIEKRVRPLDWRSVAGIIGRGGTILGTSRTNPYKKKGGVAKVLESFKSLGLHALVAMGGGRFEPGAEGPVLVLPRDSRWVQIRYSALSFTAPSKVRFRHRMGHRDRDWVEAGTDRVAAFDGIVPGRYRFEVIVANNDGVWNSTGTGLVLVVPPHFWQSTWFRGCAGLGFVVLIAATVRMWSVRRLRVR